MHALAVIDRHAVFRHPFWDAFHDAIPTLTLERCATIFWQIDCVTAASRNAGCVADELTHIGMEAQGRAIVDILASESGHQEQLHVMFAHVLHTAFPEACAHVDPSTVRAFLRDAAKKYTGGDGLLPGSRRMMELFAVRNEHGREHALFSLGVMLAVECLANRSYIPGCVRAFVGNPRWGDTSIDNPAFRYLAEHAGADGAEARHEHAMLHALGIDADGTTGEAMTRGVHALCDAATMWYDDMKSVLRS